MCMNVSPQLPENLEGCYKSHNEFLPSSSPRSIPFINIFLRGLFESKHNLSGGKLPFAESEGSNSVYLLPRPFWNYSPSGYHHPNSGREGILPCLDIVVETSKVYGKITLRVSALTKVGFFFKQALVNVESSMFSYLNS